MDGREKNKDQLREGFSTGACVAACAKAAYLKLEEVIAKSIHFSKLQVKFQGQNLHLKAHNKNRLAYDQSLNINVLFPDKVIRTLKLHNVYSKKNSSHAQIIKDAGSDPDITNGMLIDCSIEYFLTDCKVDPRDYSLIINDSTLIVRGEEGVGTVTRNGVAPQKGKWAINQTPIKMIADNLSEAGFGKREYSTGKTFILKIRLINGEKLADKTLNPLLGIKGGLSVLGTTGIVVPYSHAAYIETIRILINSLERDNYKHIVFTTGAQTTNAARKIYPNLPEEAFIRIGDFIADSLRFIQEKSIDRVTVACMPGKLFKYACFFDNTNVKYSSIDTKNILLIGEQNNFYFTKEEQIMITNAVTIRDVINSLDNNKRHELLNLWRKLALKFFRKILKNSKTEVELLVTIPKAE